MNAANGAPTANPNQAVHVPRRMSQVRTRRRYQSCEYIARDPGGAPAGCGVI